MVFLRHAIFKNVRLLKILAVVVLPLSILDISIVCASESFGELLGLSGSVRTAYWDYDKSYSGVRGYMVGSVWLTLQPASVSGYKFYADGYIQGQDLSHNDSAEGELREAYIEKSAGDFDFKVGRAIIVWGRADKINPTDNLTIRNYTRLMTFDEDQRTGLFSAKVDYYSDSSKFTIVWIPEWRSPIYPISSINGVNIQDKDPVHPEEQIALKIDRSGGAVDWSMSYFNGYNKSPDLMFVSMSGPGVQLALDYGKIEVYGADFATTFGSYGLRGEVAYTQTSDTDGNNPSKQNSNIFAVVGGDRSFFGKFNINVQLLLKHVFSYQDTALIPSSTTRLIAKHVNLNSNQLAENMLGVSFRPSYKMLNDTLEIELVYVRWFKKGDSLMRPKLTYAFNDQFKGVLGAEIYNGPADSFFGRRKETSSGFIELKWLF